MIKERILQWIDGFFNEIYNIGFIEDRIEKDLKKEPFKIKWLRHNYRKGWFADPFILNITPEKIEILVEEFNYESQKGRIDKLTVCRKDFKLQKIDVVLELDTHLSFPAILRIGEDVYIYPENSEGKKLALYKYIPKENKFIYYHELIGEPLIDAIHFEDEGKHYILANHLPDNWGKNLSIYKSDSLTGVYNQTSAHDFENFEGRGAGNIFHLGKHLIRPVQDCNGAYGKGIILHEMIKKQDHFIFQEISRLYPSERRYRGIHTLNMEGDLMVVDGKKYVYPNIVQSIKMFIRILNKEYY